VVVRNGVHALAEAVRTVLDLPTAGDVCMIGTYFGMKDLFGDRNSGLRGRVAPFHDMTPFTTAHMVRLLQHYFAGMNPLPDGVEGKLRTFEGRPIYFCDIFLKALLDERGSTVAERIDKAIESASTRARTDLTEDVLKSTFFPEPSSTRRHLFAGAEASTIFAQLYHAAVMRGGKVPVCDDHVGSRLAEKGVLVWRPGTREADLGAEPLLLAGLRRLGEEALVKGRDCIGELLVSSLGLVGKEMKGAVLQEAAAWGVLRSCLIPRQRSLPLGLAVLPGVALPRRLEGFVARARVVVTVRVDANTSPFASLFDAEGKPRTDSVFMGFPDKAGVDLAYWAVRESDGATVLVLVQCKVGAADIVDSVRSVTPAWQYVEKEQRRALAHRSAGEVLARTMEEALDRASAERTAFWDVVGKHERAFSTAVRVILSPGTVSRAAVDVVKALDEAVERSPSSSQGQEVLIATMTDDWAGPALAKALQQLGGKLTARTKAKPDGKPESKPLACDLLPQSVAAVRATWSDPNARATIAGGTATPEDGLRAWVASARAE
jgi:hypothetical protein